GRPRRESLRALPRQRDSPGRRAEGRGRRNPRRRHRDSDLLHQRPPVLGRPATGELRARDRGGAGAGPLTYFTTVKVVAALPDNGVFFASARALSPPTGSCFLSLNFPPADPVESVVA